MNFLSHIFDRKMMFDKLPIQRYRLFKKIKVDVESVAVS
jgi:hypothetical protein